jgi:methylmalonyl-CoA carboxyltransferase 5S subunit
MFPQVAPKFFPARAQGPKNLGKDPNAEAPASAAASTAATPQSAGSLAGPISYKVEFNGKSHKVTVSPA